jgi:hypothetical protein
MFHYCCGIEPDFTISFFNWGDYAAPEKHVVLRETSEPQKF